MEVDQLVRRFARDQWVRLHGTPRVTVLAGDAPLLALYRSWLSLTNTNIVLFAGDDLEPLVRKACAHASEVPGDAVALHASIAAIERWRAGRTDRLAAMIAEGLVRAEQGAPASRSPVASTNLDARSAAEAVLFEALEATASTAGKFELNAVLAVRFGSVACEVDLLARRERIAIEIDGYHHFTDADAYRRDRRKDLLMQQQGLVVIRVLAEDVVVDPRPAINMVCQALATRRGQR